MLEAYCVGIYRTDTLSDPRNQPFSAPLQGKERNNKKVKSTLGAFLCRQKETNKNIHTMTKILAKNY